MSSPHAPAPKAPTLQALRQRAEALSAHWGPRNPPNPVPINPAQAEHLLHELHVHEIELETQNEDLRRALAELEDTRARWFDLYEQAPAGYCTVSEPGLVLQANLAAARLWQRQLPQILGRRFSLLIHPHDQHQYFQLREQLLRSGEPQACELRCAPDGAEPTWLHLSASVSGRHRQRMLLIVLVDISERKRAEAADKARLVADETRRAKSLLLARMHHTLRAPLAAALAALQPPDDTPAVAPAAPPPGHAGALQRLLAGLDDLMDLSLIEACARPLQLALVDALAALQQAQQTLAATAQARQVHLALATAPEPVVLVRADATRLQQVLQALLSNAIQYNRPGGQAWASLQRVPGGWQISVHDNGLGMTAAQQAALFEPFNRLGREPSGTEGTGLGLLLARALAQAMGGQIELHSQPGEGSRFELTLPAA